MYTQDFDPVSNALGLSSVFAVLPILTLFILLGGLRLAAQWAALVADSIAAPTCSGDAQCTCPNWTECSCGRTIVIVRPVGTSRPSMTLATS